MQKVTAYNQKIFIYILFTNIYIYIFIIIFLDFMTSLRYFTKCCLFKRFWSDPHSPSSFASRLLCFLRNATLLKPSMFAARLQHRQTILRNQWTQTLLRPLCAHYPKVRGGVPPSARLKTKSRRVRKSSCTRGYDRICGTVKYPPIPWRNEWIT